MKKGIFVGALITLLWIPSYAYAKGTANVKIEGNNNVNIGDEFKVNMVVDNILEAEGGVVAFSGYISYDKDVLEIVDAKSANEYFDVIRNASINKIVGLDYSLAHGVYSRSNLYEITFRGINEGNTTVVINSAELVDKTAEELDVNSTGLNITVNKVVEETPIEEKTVENIPIEEVKNEEKTEVKVVKTIQKVEKVDTQEVVEEKPIENKEEIVVEKTIKNTKKAVKNTAKSKKSSNKFTKFIRKIFNKIIKK